MASSCAVCGARKQASIHLGRINPGWHAFQDARRPGMKPMSDGMQAFREASGYAAAVEAAKGTPCQIVSPVCTGTSEHLHEPLSRGRAGGLRAALRDGPQPIPCCDACNGYIMEHPVWAMERGFLLSRKGT